MLYFTSDVFENTYDFFIIFTNLKFPCPEHKKQMMAAVFSSSIIIQMKMNTPILKKNKTKN